MACFLDKIYQAGNPFLFKIEEALYAELVSFLYPRHGIRCFDFATALTHNHSEGIKGARAVMVAAWMAGHGSSKEGIRERIDSEYYPLNFTLDSIRDTYQFDETCQGSVPQAIEAFLESESFEDAIRNAISIGGDSDTIAAITGSIAEEFYSVPDEITIKARSYLSPTLLSILDAFEEKYPV